MATKITIAVIGAIGKPGSEIARRISKDNYRLLLVAEENNQLNQLSKQLKRTNPHTEVEIVGCAKDGCWEADIIIMAISFAEAKEMVGKIKEVATQKVVLCISNNTKTTSFPFAEAQQLQQLLPHSKVVAAFHNEHSMETFLAGDDKDAVEFISTITRAMGHHPVVADSLSAIKSL